MGNKFRLKLSEKGMGHQLVDIELKSGLKLINRIVINSTLLELNTNKEFWNKDIKELKIKLK
ncbi:MAG: hypothetical protein ACI93N_000020 [Flavobacteriaceae bacterium]|jgi:hypothetical protein